MTADLMTEVLVPRAGPTRVTELLASVAQAPRREPYSDRTVEMCAELSRRLARRGGSDPAVQALAFWMRRSELRRLQAQYSELASDDILLVPRGTVFHLPPANVDTIFVYSWLLSVLAGNTNVIRLPQSRTGVSDRILELLNEVLAEAADDGPDRHTFVISYGHDDELTAAFSAACDMRVIWGGDTTVRAIRAIPVPPHATELTFGDRTSLAVFETSAYTALPPEERLAVAERLYNDSYLFDQMACSSPRLLVWVGDPGAMARASALLVADLEQVVGAKGYRVDTSAAIAKMTYRARAAIDHRVERQDVRGNELAVLTVAEPLDVGDDFCGAGLFWQTSCRSLDELAGYLGRRHQTVSHFGFDATELRGLALRLSGRGVDRLVPVGEALTFNRYWDGHDLMRAYLRSVHVQPETRGL